MSISSKISSYDFLTMMVSGFLIIYPFCPWLVHAGGIDIFATTILCYVIGLIYNKLMETCFACYRNKRSWIQKAYCKQQKTLGQDIEKLGIKNTFSDYYRMYYVLMKQNCLGNIPILETQVAFMRNLVPILLFYFMLIICLCPCIETTIERLCLCKEALWVFIPMFTVLVIFIWYKKQIQIHELVWEGGYYLTKLQTEKQ